MTASGTKDKRFGEVYGFVWFGVSPFVSDPLALLTYVVRWDGVCTAGDKARWSAEGDLSGHGLGQVCYFTSRNDEQLTRTDQQKQK